MRFTQWQKQGEEGDRADKEEGGICSRKGFLQIFKVVIEGIVWCVRLPHLFSKCMFDWIRLMMEVTCALDFKEKVRGLGLWLGW